MDWGAEHRRDLPWRSRRDPWAVLVSEVMLQQTQVDRVVPAYRAFLAAFPTVGDCARARPAEVLRLWSGLGYNRRGLNLHRAARAVVTEHGGSFPPGDADLRSLPGVGPYTARAVRAFAFGADVAAVDTNVVRVLSRCVAGAPLTVATAQTMGDRLVPAGASWEFNQTMFDLGATVCTPRPGCAGCPLRRQCRWHAGGLTDPDPWRASPVARRQAAFAGSDRQGRGRLLAALVEGPVTRARLAAACGWPGDEERADRISRSLVDEGFAEWRAGSDTLRLR